MIDDVLLAGQISNLPNPQDFKIVDASLSVEPYAPMFAKDDPAFKALVDKTIVGMMKDGTLDKLYKKWFESPIPPKNANLNFPMNSVTKELFANPTSDGIYAQAFTVPGTPASNRVPGTPFRFKSRKQEDPRQGTEHDPQHSLGNLPAE